QVLEISNLAPFPLALQVGAPVCQFIFQKTKGRAVYQGRHQNQDRL
ncbi:MAG: dCTP deaminase, partial [Deltaproteobacteria bacterium]|nr:dCTP deaminase [Deltaproteobacteria bacterium]